MLWARSQILHHLNLIYSFSKTLNDVCLHTVQCLVSAAAVCEKLFHPWICGPVRSATCRWSWHAAAARRCTERSNATEAVISPPGGVYVVWGGGGGFLGREIMNSLGSDLSSFKDNTFCAAPVIKQCRSFSSTDREFNCIPDFGDQ